MTGSDPRGLGFNLKPRQDFGVAYYRGLALIVDMGATILAILENQMPQMLEHEI